MKNKRRACGVLAVLMLLACLAAPGTGLAAGMTIVDMVQIARFMSGQIELTPAQQASYDLTGDGRVNVADLVALARLLTGDVSSPAMRPDYAQVVYSYGGRNVTVGDLTQIGYLVGGMLNGSDSLDFNRTGASERALLAGLYALDVIRRDPSGCPQTAPLGTSLLADVSAALSKTELIGSSPVQWTIPRQALEAVSRELFGSARLADNVTWKDGRWETEWGQPAYAQDVALVQFARYRHTTMALAVYDVTVRENAFGQVPGSFRIALQFDISRNAFAVFPLMLLRLEPDQLEQESDVVAVYFPPMVPV